MFDFIKKREAKKYIDGAKKYFEQNYIEPVDYGKSESTDSFIRYSIRGESKPKSKDTYDQERITSLMRNYSYMGNADMILIMLNENENQTFVDKLVYHIDKKGFKDSKVYKAAQVDKRLFSKINSDREYKPSKDTAIALSMGLELSVEEANDMLSRAGYTFSHSNKRDIIIEYFFREKVYDLIIINEVLYHLDQKLIGRL